MWAFTRMWDKQPWPACGDVCVVCVWVVCVLLYQWVYTVCVYDWGCWHVCVCVNGTDTTPRSCCLLSVCMYVWMVRAFSRLGRQRCEKVRLGRPPTWNFTSSVLNQQCSRSCGQRVSVSVCVCQWGRERNPLRTSLLGIWWSATLGCWNIHN